MQAIYDILRSFVLNWQLLWANLGSLVLFVVLKCRCCSDRGKKLEQKGEKVPRQKTTILFKVDFTLDQLILETEKKFSNITKYINLAPEKGILFVIIFDLSKENVVSLMLWTLISIISENTVI